MYKVITIGGKDYKLEYSIEAAMYQDGIDRFIDFLGGLTGFSEEESITKNLDEDKKSLVRKELAKALKSEITGVPQMSLTMFYMGLLEHHGTGSTGDGTVLSLNDAKDLVKILFSEQPEDGIKDFESLLSVCFNQMGEDGFFKMTGVEQFMTKMMPQPNRETRRKTAKKKATEAKS